MSGFVRVALVLALFALPADGIGGSVPDRGQGEPGVPDDLERLDDLEQRAGRLVAGLNRSRYRLALLAEQILARRIAGAEAALRFRNEIGRMLKLDRVVFVLDEEPVLLRRDVDGDLAGTEDLVVFEGPVAPGDHVLVTTLEYRGRGLPYMGSYTVKLRSSHAFTVNEGQAIALDVIGYEKGVFKPVTERPRVRYVERISDID